MCWGANWFGQRGSEASGSSSLVPNPTDPPLTKTTSISTGPLRTCAVSASEVYCWGGQMTMDDDDLTSIDRHPKKITALGTGIVAVAAGSGHTCALAEDHKIRCYGANNYGQLGIGTTEPITDAVTVPGISATAIAAGFDYTCALTVAGAVNCWGSNDMGNLGNATLATSPTPQQVQGVTQHVTGIAIGHVHTCAFTSVGARCWGYNGYGQLGNNKSGDSNIPVHVLFP